VIRPSAVVALVVVAIASAGCGSDLATPAGVPECEPSGELVIIAQAVPSATLVPCIDTLPIGWEFAGMDVRRDRSRFWLGNDRAGARAVRISLEETCDTARATALPPDDPRTVRSLRLDQLEPRSTGAWFHEFPGGCVTYDFSVPKGRYDFDAFNVELDAALDFFERSAIATEVADRYGAPLDVAARES
jgi:hypothetical protein